MSIIVDADACPVKEEIFAVARARGVKVVLIASLNHVMPEGEGIEVVAVDPEPQAADIAIANRAREHDIVVTGDYGLACMVLGRRARVIGFRGQIYHAGNIEGLMASRHLNARRRRAGERQRGPRPLEADDRTRFRAALESLLDSGS